MPQCNVCVLSFQTEEDLRKHLNGHTAEEKKNPANLVNTSANEIRATQVAADTGAERPKTKFTLDDPENRAQSKDDSENERDRERDRGDRDRPLNSSIKDNDTVRIQKSNK